MTGSSIRLLRLLVASAIVLIGAEDASAQVGGGFGPGAGGGFGGGAGGNRPSAPRRGSQQPQQAKPPDGAPELHAAGGGESTIPQGNEPGLPENPLEIPDDVQAQIGSDFVPEEHDVGRNLNQRKRLFLGPYFSETSQDYKLNLLFPFWFQRTQPSLSDPSVDDTASLYGALYYRRRSASRADDVLFPFFWNLRNKDSRTTIVGPLLNRSTKNESDNWLAPLYFTGTREHGGYTIIPPLLTYMNEDEEGGFNLFGPAYCSWEQGTGCFGKAKRRKRGIFPLYFDGEDENGDYRVIPPLLHYHEKDEAAGTELNVWGPVYHKMTEELESFHVFPFYFSSWGENERSTTLLPFFHYSWERDAHLRVTPLWLDSRDEDGNELFATWGYARYRGETELDMITPLFWWYRDPALQIDQKLLFPFYYSRTSPREDSLALFPFYADFKRKGVGRDIWVTPFFRHSHDYNGWSTNLYPFLFFGRDGRESHSVVAPIFWDFSSPDERTTIAFPLYWRFADRNSVSQLIGNVYYTEKRVKQGWDWRIHILPFFSYGETPDGHSWDVLYGLAGYKRRGSRSQMSVFWAPIQLSE